MNQNIQYTDELRRDLQDLNQLAESFGNRLVSSLAGAVIHGRNLADVMRGLALSLSNQALSSALKPLGNLVGDAVSNVLGPITQSAASPLQSQAQSAAPAARNITVNIATPDAQSFRQSQAQVSAMIARAVAQGQRNL